MGDLADANIEFAPGGPAPVIDLWSFLQLGLVLFQPSVRNGRMTQRVSSSGLQFASGLSASPRRAGDKDNDNAR